MTESERYALDTNVLVYAADRTAGERRERALQVLGRCAQLDAVCVLQTLGEFFHATTRKKLLTPDDARRFIDSCRDVYPVFAAGVVELETALDLRARRSISFWDAMLLTTAASAGCTVLLSEDMQDGEVINGVRIVDPFSHDLEELGP